MASVEIRCGVDANGSIDNPNPPLPRLREQYRAGHFDLPVLPGESECRASAAVAESRQ